MSQIIGNSTILYSIACWLTIHASFSVVPVPKLIEHLRGRIRQQYVHVWESVVVTALIVWRFMKLGFVGLHAPNHPFDEFILQVCVGYYVYDLIVPFFLG